MKKKALKKAETPKKVESNESKMKEVEKFNPEFVKYLRKKGM